MPRAKAAAAGVFGVAEDREIRRRSRRRRRRRRRATSRTGGVVLLPNLATGLSRLSPAVVRAGRGDGEFDAVEAGVGGDAGGGDGAGVEDDGALAREAGGYAAGWAGEVGGDADG